MKWSVAEMFVFLPHSALHISDHFLQSYFQYLYKF